MTCSSLRSCFMVVMESTPPGKSNEPTTSGLKSYKSAKICGVCGDKAKSYHFGGLSCDSCKAFFRRSVQNDAHKSFHCPYDKNCEISISSRKCCQYCRFQKCVMIGMEKTWVMTEEERLQLLRQRMERKTKKDRRPASSPSPAQRAEQHAYPLTDTEASVINDVVQKYHVSIQEVPYDDSLQETNENRPVLDMISMLTTTIQRMTHFAGSLDTFRRLSKDDQAILLRNGMIEMCIIRGAFAYDPIMKCWPNCNLLQYRRSPYMMEEDFQKLISPELHQLHMNFNQSLQNMNLDETTFMLLLLIVLFSPDRPSLQNAPLVSDIQESYLSLLRKHMNSRYHVDVASKLYPKLLLKLPDLRQVNDAHTEHHLQLTEGDIRSIQQQFGNVLHTYNIESPSSSSEIGHQSSSLLTLSSSSAATEPPSTPSSGGAESLHPLHFLCPQHDPSEDPPPILRKKYQ